MAIQIVENLTATPNPTGLPGDVTFRQLLLTNRSEETVDAEYSMDSGHNVWFKAESGQLTKTVAKTGLVVSAAGTQLTDEIEMVENGGQGPMDTVEVKKVVTDSGGHPTTDLCLLGIER